MPGVPVPPFCQACGGRLRRRRVDGRARGVCRRCGFVFYGNPVPAAVALIVRGGRVLLGRRAHPPFAGTWDPPGGFLEADESPEQGLRRELREELGVGARGVRLLGFVTDRYGPGGFSVLAAVYRATLAPGRLRPADDVSELRWFGPAEVPYREIAFASMRRMLRRYFGNDAAGRTARGRRRGTVG